MAKIIHLKDYKKSGFKEEIEKNKKKKEKDKEERKWYNLNLIRRLGLKKDKKK